VSYVHVINANLRCSVVLTHPTPWSIKRTLHNRW